MKPVDLNGGREYIDVVEVRRISEVVELPDVYQLRGDRPLVWLQRVCIWILGKLGCQTSTEVSRIERHHIGRNGQAFMSQLARRKVAILGSFDFEPTRLLIGPSEWEELMGEIGPTTAFEFDAEWYKKSPSHTGYCVMGLHVEVIPWMRGMLLLR